MTLLRRTLSRQALIEGPGLFTGEPARLTLRPARAGEGIRFVRRHDGHESVIRACVDNVAPAPRRTVLRNGKLDVQRNGKLDVQTVEHCLAALAGLGVTDADLEVENTATGELPMGDGSGRPFVDALLEAGLQDTDVGVDPLVVTRPVAVASEDGRAQLAALPGPQDHLEVVYVFEAPAPVGRQTYVFRLYPPGHAGGGGDDFTHDLAPARTFLFAPEAEQLRQRGVGGHLTHRDLVVIGDDGPIDNAFRFPDECARHKVLDLIGDLSLVGKPVFGRLVATKSGHDLNHRLAKALCQSERGTPPAATPPGTAVTPAPGPDWRDLVQRTAAADAPLDVRKIQRILPHRYPMLLVDRVLELRGDQRAVGLKNVTMGDVFFLGHYPGSPIFPGVLIVEAMAQLGGILLSRKLEHTGKLAVLLSMDGVKMRQPVVPGDQLVLVAEAVRVRQRTGHVRCQAFVMEKLAAEADIKFMLVDAQSD